jgi:GNAT superfamily N-acetyltransferase
MQDRAFLQRAGERAGERHLQPVENPGNAERNHDEGMKPAPRQTIEARGNVGFHDAGHGRPVDTTFGPARRVIDLGRRFSRRRVLDASRTIGCGRRLLDRARLVAASRRFVDRRTQRIRAALGSIVRQQGAIVAHAVFI